MTWFRTRGKCYIVGYLPEIKKETSGVRRVFGPVPSRRLGLSLGLDLAPRKTCTQDCLYCEVGRTTCRTIRRAAYIPAGIILDQLREVLPEIEARLDYVTLAGSGEPTLNTELGRIIAEVKAMTRVPVCVLTNGTLLFLPEVRKELAAADVVIPSLDTARPETFQRLNRPAPGLDLDTVIKGLAEFRREFEGGYWLEVLLAAGYNDSFEELEALKAVIDRLEPDLIQVNTVFRPPAYEAVQPVAAEVLAEAARIFGPRAEAVGSFSRSRRTALAKDHRAEVLALLGRRPCTVKDVAESLGLSDEEVNPIITGLESGGLIRHETHDRQTFYLADR